MTSLHLSVVPRRSGRNQLVLHVGFFQSNVKRTAFRFADILVCEFRSVVCLNDLYLERKYPLKHLKKFYGIFRCMFFKSIDKPYSGTLIDGCPLIKVFSISLCSTFQTVVGHFLNIYLYFLSRNKQFGVSAFIPA